MAEISRRYIDKCWVVPVRKLFYFHHWSPDIVFKSTLMLYSSITSYHFQQILVSQSAIICNEILSTALFSTTQTNKMHCTTTTDRTIISQPHYVVVGRYQKQNTFVYSGVRRKFSWGVLVQSHMVVICIWCSLFISMFPNQRFGKVSWHNNAYFSTSTPFISCGIALNINYQRSKLRYRRKINSTLRHSSS